MKRYTRTKLEKIIFIGFARIDQIIDKACDDLDAIKPKKIELPLPTGGILRDSDPMRRAQSQRNDCVRAMTDKASLAAQQNMGLRQAGGCGGAGQAGIGLIGGLFG